jgi:hypothetical protein
VPVVHGHKRIRFTSFEKDNSVPGSKQTATSLTHTSNSPVLNKIRANARSLWQVLPPMHKQAPHLHHPRVGTLQWPASRVVQAAVRLYGSLLVSLAQQEQNAQLFWALIEPALFDTDRLRCVALVLPFAHRRVNVGTNAAMSAKWHAPARLCPLPNFKERHVAQIPIDDHVPQVTKLKASVPGYLPAATHVGSVCCGRCSPLVARLKTGNRRKKLHEA